MPLDPATEQLVKQWLQAHCPNLACPACGSQQFGGAELAYSTLAQTPVTRGIQPPPGLAPNLLPLVYVFCANCSCTLAFSAPLMGVTPKLPGLTP